MGATEVWVKNGLTEMVTGIPSDFDLVPHLRVLDRLVHQIQSPQQGRHVSRLTEQLAFYLRGACYAYSQMEELRIHAGERFVKMFPDDNGAKWLLEDDLWDSLSWTADSFLNCLRRSLDALIHYLNFTRQSSESTLPESFHSFVEKLNKGLSFRISTQLSQPILAFWSEIGSRIKGYRDQANHKAAILSNCVLFYHPVTGGVGMRMLLPDNSSEKSPYRITYEKNVSAMAFFVSALGATVRLVNTVVESLIDLLDNQKDARQAYLTTVRIRGNKLDIESHMRDGDSVPFSVSLMAVIKRATSS